MDEVKFTANELEPKTFILNVLTTLCPISSADTERKKIGFSHFSYISAFRKSNRANASIPFQ